MSDLNKALLPWMLGIVTIVVVGIVSNMLGTWKSSMSRAEVQALVDQSDKTIVDRVVATALAQHDTSQDVKYISANLADIKSEQVRLNAVIVTALPNIERQLDELKRGSRTAPAGVNP